MKEFSLQYIKNGNAFSLPEVFLFGEMKVKDIPRLFRKYDNNRNLYTIGVFAALYASLLAPERGLLQSWHRD